MPVYAIIFPGRLFGRVLLLRKQVTDLPHVSGQEVDDALRLGAEFLHRPAEPFLEELPRQDFTRPCQHGREGCDIAEIESHMCKVGAAKRSEVFRASTLNEARDVTFEEVPLISRDFGKLAPPGQCRTDEASAIGAQRIDAEAGPVDSDGLVTPIKKLPIGPSLNERA